jgi:hypothetical protein
MRTVLVAILCALAPASAETIDRVAVAVGNRVITTSDIERQARVSAFLSGTKPDLTPEGRRRTAEMMVEQKLISRELETARYPEPGPAELDEAFSDFKSKYFTNDADYRRALAEAGVTEAEVKQELLYQRRFFGFIGVRFRPAAQVGEEAIREYFERTVLPAAKAANPDASYTLDEFRDKIQAKLVEDAVDRQIALWLAEARSRTEIVFHEEAFR